MTLVQGSRSVKLWFVPTLDPLLVFLEETPSSASELWYNTELLAPCHDHEGSGRYSEAG
jgi:hypothetical protein